MLRKSVDWFLYDNGPRHERVNIEREPRYRSKFTSILSISKFLVEFLYTKFVVTAKLLNCANSTKSRKASHIWCFELNLGTYGRSILTTPSLKC